MLRSRDQNVANLSAVSLGSSSQAHESARRSRNTWRVAKLKFADLAPPACAFRALYRRLLEFVANLAAPLAFTRRWIGISMNR